MTDTAQALPVVGLPAEHARPDDFILLKTGEGWMAHTYNYWAKFATEEEARAYIALLEYRASLPAQPAQSHEAVVDALEKIEAKS